MYKYKKIIFYFLELCVCLIMLEVLNLIRQVLFYDDFSFFVCIILFLYCIIIFLFILYIGLFNFYIKYLVIKDF